LRESHKNGGEPQPSLARGGDTYKGQAEIEWEKKGGGGGSMKERIK